MSRLKKDRFFGKLIFIVGLLLLWSLIRGFLGFRRAYKRVDEAKEVLEIENRKNEELEAKLQEVQKDDYIDKVVRNELNMQKEGETVIILPDNDFVQINESELPTEEEKRIVDKWFDLIR
jgi:cell division protein FtsB